MKILELTNYSSGICGVWNRVREESLRLSKKHDVRVFSSNFVKGSDKTTFNYDKVGKVKIERFPATKLGGESYMEWDFEKEALKFKPDVIIAHSYRHPHTRKALEIGKRIGAKVFLVTHGPFGKSDTRSMLGKIAVWFHDFFFGKEINKFNKVVIIANWEIPYLKRFGVKSEKITYIPNGIPEEFFKEKKGKEENKILFFGRISPVKNLETLISAFTKIKDKKIVLEMAGPAEKEYLKFLKEEVQKKGVKKRVIFSKPIYKLKDKIKKIDSANIFVLPSKREAMPQALVEAMAREKVAIASATLGGKEIIQDEKNGFLFKIGDSNALARTIDRALSGNMGQVRKRARLSVEKFNWSRIIGKIEGLF